MLGASVDILDQLLELSVTGDTAKYLVLHSREVVHVHHLTQSAQTILHTPLVIRKRRRLRRDLWETVPCSSGRPIQDIHPM